MTLKGRQLAALVNLGLAMAAADGRLADEENVAMCLELEKFGVKEDDLEKLFAIAQTMSNTEAITIISAMTDEQKKHASGFLAAIMVADGNIDISEAKLWALICVLGQLPSMTIKEAISFWNSKH